MAAYKQAKEEPVDIDYLPRARPVRRRALSDEFDRECGYSYDHQPVFVRFVYWGNREYECANCGHRWETDGKTYDACNPDIHEMLEVGALELAFQPHVTKSPDTIRLLREDHRSLRESIKRRRRPTLDEEERNV